MTAILDAIVSSKFSALLLALLGLVLLWKLVVRPLKDNLIMHLKRNRERGEAMEAQREARFRFLEEQVLGMAEAETDCVSLGAAAVTLISQTAVGGERLAGVEQYRLLAEKYEKLEFNIKQRHITLMHNLKNKVAVTR